MKRSTKILIAIGLIIAAIVSKVMLPWQWVGGALTGAAGALLGITLRDWYREDETKHTKDS